MSAYVYGRIRRDRLDGIRVTSGDNKIVEGLVAIIPVDIITLHAVVLSLTTTTNKTTGEVSITDPTTLKNSLFVFIVLAAALFVIGHLKTSDTPAFKWDSWDWLRIVLPPLAFLAWAGLTGVSALTPWILNWSKAWVALSAGVIGIVVLALATATAEEPPPAP